MKVFHVTSASNARSIKDHGFRDSVGRFEPLTEVRWGVWIANRPLDRGEHCCDQPGAIFQFEIDENSIAAHEYVKEGKPYREWLVPAGLLNGLASSVEFRNDLGRSFQIPAGDRVAVICDVDFNDATSKARR